jgi:hypothetical protein
VRGFVRREAREEKKSREGLIPLIKLKSLSFPLLQRGMKGGFFSLRRAACR